MANNRVHFFAFKEDLLPVLELAEELANIKYTRTGNFLAGEYNAKSGVFSQGLDLPGLGKAKYPSSSLLENYLVSDETKDIQERHLEGTSGVSRILIDQLENHDTLVLSAGGLWTDRVLLSGRIATAYETAETKRLLSAFKKGFSKSFIKVKAFLVGPMALQLLDSGGRLTDAEQSPVTYDLTRN